MLSIIIPYFNNREQLDRLLKSIPESKKIEAVIINDHSTLEPSDYVMSRKNVVYLDNEINNKGAGSARNVGLAVSSNDYILFADSDDYFVKGAFELIFDDYIEKKKFDIAFFYPTSTNSHGGVGTRHLAYTFLLDETQDRLKYDFHVPWSKLYRKKFLMDNCIKFDDVIASNDVMFSLRSACLTDSIIVSNEEIYCVTETAGSLTKSNNNKNVFDSRIKVLFDYNKYILDNKIKTNQKSFLKYIIFSLRNFGFFNSLNLLKRVLKEKNKIFPSCSELIIYFRKIRYFKRSQNQDR
ncbi:glycosyltransferase family 2 protein [Vibrio breoganii]